MAFGEIACDSSLGSDKLKIFSFRYIPPYITNQRIFKFNYFATAETYNVVMFCGGLNLIVMVRLIKMAFLHQPQFLKSLKGSIDSRQTQAGSPFSRQTINFISIQVPSTPANNLQNQGSLTGKSHTACVQISTTYPNIHLTIYSMSLMRIICKFIIANA